MALTIKISAFQNPGDVHVFRVTDESDRTSPFVDSFVIRVASNTNGNATPHPDGGYLVAYGPACTHMGCLLVRDDEHDIVYEPGDNERAICGPCPCHGTTFDLLKDGLVILGPATQNLPRIKLKLGGPENDPHVEPDGWFEQEDPRFEHWPSHPKE